MKKLSKDRLATKIANWLWLLQKMFVQVMNMMVGACSLQSLKIIAIVFVSLLSTLSVILFFQGIDHEKRTVIRVTHINLPVLPAKVAPMQLKENSLYNRIHTIRLLLDSIKLGNKASALKDSVLFYRPGLYDSVVRVEKMIQ